MTLRLAVVVGTTAVAACLACGDDKATGPTERSTWFETFGGAGRDIGYEITAAHGGGYVIAGERGGADIWASEAYLIKIDESGRTVWEKTFDGADNSVATAVIATEDGGYVLGGYTGSRAAITATVFLIKTNGEGEVIWRSDVPDEGWNNVNALAATSDGGYVVAGWQQIADGEFIQEVNSVLIRLDASGIVLWKQIRGDSVWHNGNAVLATGDGGAVIAGGQFSRAGVGAFLAKIDATGNEVWREQYGDSARTNAHAVTPTADGGYVLVGSFVPEGAMWPGGYAARTDGSGMLVWEKFFPFMVSGSLSSVVPAWDGGFLAVGATDASGPAGYNGYLIKFSEQGTPLWGITIGRGGDDNFRAVVRSADGGYVAVGTTDSFGAGGDDIFVVKVDADGRFKFDELF